MRGARYTFNSVDLMMPMIRSIGFHNFNHTIGLNWHRHFEGPEITFVLKGTAAWQADGETYTQPGGSVLVMPENIEHKGAETVITPCSLLWFILDRNAADGFFSEAERQKLFSGLERVSQTVMFFHSRTARLLNRLVELFQSGKEDELDMIEFRLTLYLVLLEMIRLSDRPDIRKNSIMGQAEKYITRNLDGDISVDDIAAACGLSGSQFARRFQAETGLTPWDYVMRRKIEKAEHELKHTGKSVTEVAFALGFSSSQYFATVFKRYTGYTPSRLKKN